MIIDEFFKVVSHFSFASSHCDVLEERSQQLLDEMHALKDRQKEDKVLYEAEFGHMKRSHKTLDKLEDTAKAIQACAEEALPELRHEEAEYKKQLEQMQTAALAIFIPEAIVAAEESMASTLAQYQEVAARVEKLNAKMGK